MKRSYTAALLAAMLLLLLTACGKAQTDERQPQEQENMQDTASGQEKSAGEEAWKAEFEKSLLENYGVTPDHYESLGDGIYQVYVELNGQIVPYVTVDSATGDYHG